MQILSVHMMPGANIYSHRSVLRVRLELGEDEDVPTNELGDFSSRLLAVLPGLAEHACSRGYPGGFAERLTEGTYLPHVFEHVVIELQCLAGYEVSFGKARETDRAGRYDVVVGYRVASAAEQAVKEAGVLMAALLAGGGYDAAAAVGRVHDAGEAGSLGPSTAAIAEAAGRRGIPITRVASEDLLILGYGCRQQRVWATVTGRTGALAVDLACDKSLTKHVLAGGGVPVPEGLVVDSAAEAVRAAGLLGRPVAVKPAGGNQGKGVTLNVTSPSEVERAFTIAAAFDSRVLVEEFIPGRQYRLCIVGGKMAAAAERIPAYVTGDGVHTVSELVELVNRDPLRGEGHERPLTRIKIDPVAITVLARQELTSQTVPEAGRVVYIRENANLSTGGTAVDVTDAVHPDNVLLAERAAMLLGLDVAGVDLVAEDIGRPITDGHGVVIEVNAAPGIRMHHYPSAGKPRDVAARVVDHLFPRGDGRIPVIVVTGTNGKTTVSRMIGHIWQHAGYCAGMTTTDGIYIGNRRVMGGDATGPVSARTVLTDPAVEVAVLETARGGIQRSGLGFDACDVAVITNISEDHFGQDGIEDIDDLVFIKSLVAEVVRPGGHILLNADDPYVTAVRGRAKGEVVYFSTEPDNLLVRRHLSVGGKAFFVQDGVIYAACGRLGRPVVRVEDVPVTLAGIALHNVQNAVIAAAACYCMKVPVSYIQEGLSSFEHNPGRLNMVTFGDFRVCVDYGHNPAGYQALLNTVKRLGARRLVGVIAAPGDRRDDVIMNVGRVAGYGFDYLFIKEDADLRGRRPGETAELLRRGALEAGISAERVATIYAEDEAVLAALSAALPGDLIVVFYEKYDKVTAVIESFREKRVERPAAYSVGYAPGLVVSANSL
ncbi:cyanophycin synthetase [Anaeroselena agilis]|uniref:Cyanophycin synthetase n=1 Tax=Anaeroselena agilis TaxID=3063788 RepID=A0ABU3P3T4_9FIRM|nr:cyanophycin synthetase [Selenomonadales bacterium 4137-cl]